jgi:hypothetical protein
MPSSCIRRTAARLLATHLVHLAKDGIPARPRERRRHPGRAGRRAPDEAGQDGGLWRRQVSGRLSEIAARGGLYTVVTIAQINAVEVCLQNVDLWKSPLDAQGQQRLFHLSLERAVARQHDKPHELLRNGAAADAVDFEI